MDILIEYAASAHIRLRHRSTSPATSLRTHIATATNSLINWLILRLALATFICKGFSGLLPDVTTMPADSVGDQGGETGKLYSVRESISDGQVDLAVIAVCFMVETVI